MDHPTRGEEILLRASTDESQRYRSESKLKETTAERRDVIVMTLRARVADNVDLPLREPEPAIYLTGRRALPFGIGQIELGRAGFEYHVAMRRVGDLAEALR